MITLTNINTSVIMCRKLEYSKLYMYCKNIYLFLSYRIVIF